ncbi:hypothetical protein GGI21_006100 [Coemansia aciculifera]|uniref:Uncharacterized protein n=1 Tax=Coemansia aciculifera TaxID=417176 RepID=A0ACC1LYF0_9FUNG|nr:hypothetical protein IWW38_004808 [Coemansia aciculifera]KAJ2890655.1 hypothetical protein GGI21_006100 [Coemansia aciculifera]
MDLLPIQWPAAPPFGLNPIYLCPPAWSHEDRYNGQAILPHIILGPYHLVRNKEYMRQAQIGYVICIRDPSERLFLRETPLPNVEFCFLDVPADVNKSSIIPHFNHVNQLLQTAYLSGRTTLLCCSDGIDKSAAFMSAFLMSHFGLTAMNAVTFVQNRRYCATPSPHGYRIKLLEYELLCAAQKSSEDTTMSEPKCSRRREEEEESTMSAMSSMLDQGTRPIASPNKRAR